MGIKIDLASNKELLDKLRLNNKLDIAQAAEFFAKLKRENEAGSTNMANNDGRKLDKPFMPYVMMRTFAGDRGARPLPSTVVFWESPDIWTYPAAPDAAPEIPPAIYQPLNVGKANTVYAHVWNLGRAPIAGVQVEWYWFNPSLGFTTPHAHKIGVARVDLAPRGYDGCHKLVKCPTAWVPVMENGGHECIVSRVSAFGDPLSNLDEWLPYDDRHVAQRNITVVGTKAHLAKLIESLNGTKPANATTRLFQLGAEATPSLRLVAPHLMMDPAVKTHLLAELSPKGALTMTPIKASPPRIMPHMLLNLGHASPAKTLEAGAQRKADAHIDLHDSATLTELLQHGALLQPELLKQVDIVPPPGKSQAQVLRVVSYQGDRPVGGYTIVVTG